MRREQMLKEADQIEASAKESLEAWIILGQLDKYDQKMQMAADMRRAAGMKGCTRHEFMKNKGLV